MENLLEAIRIALRDDADPAARRAGLSACREILATLEKPTDGQPTVAADSPTPAATPPPASAGSPMPAMPPIDPAAIATMIASGKLPAEQLLDLLIGRLRAALPAQTNVPAPTPVRFHLVPLHHLGPTK